MVRAADIHSLTAFLRNHKEHLERLQKTGAPEVLTVNGRARVVVQDAAAYQKLLDAFNALDAADSQRIVDAELAKLDRGEKGIPAKKVFADIRKRINRHR